MILAVIALCSFAASISSRAVDPMVVVIAQDFQVPVATAALLSSAYALPFALFQPLLGPIGDIWGKTRLLRTSLWLLTFSLLAGAIAPSLGLLLALRFIGGIAGGGTVPSGMALIGDRFSGDARQIALGRYVGAGLFAQILSASLAGVIAVAIGWRATLLAAGAVVLVVAVLASLYLRELPDRPRRTFSLGEAIGGYKLVFANPRAYVCFGTVLAEGVALWGTTPFIADLMTRSGTGGTREAGFVIGAIGLGGIVYTLALPWLLARLGRAGMMSSGGLLAVAGFLALAFDADWRLVVAGFAITGLGYMMLHNSIQTEAVELAPAARSSAYSMHAFFFFTGQSLGPIILALLLEWYGPRPGLLLNAAIFVVTGIVAARLLTAAKPK